MHRYLLAAVLVAAGLVAVNETANGLMIAIRPAPQRAVAADVVVVGKVTAIEKDTVDAPQFPGAKDKVAYKVAVVKIQTNLAGANNMTHIKIGFVPPPPPQPAPPGAVPVQPGVIRPGVRPIRPGMQVPELKEGQEMLFFLTKHFAADFYVMPAMNTPVDVATDAGKKEIEAVKKVTDLLADPMKGLKSDKADVRAETAAVMVMKYRSYPEFAAQVDHVAINAEESKLVLKAIAEGEWKAVRANPSAPNAYQAFSMLGLTEADGYKQPMFPRPQPGQPPVDFAAMQKEAFVKWLDGPGKDYRIKKLVAKKPSEK
jgi:hypothetical protein